MELIHSPLELQNRMINARTEGKRIGFVPTMGALHEGHIALARLARPDCDILVMSIFVNPLQFSPSEDLDKYPRSLDADCEKAQAAGVDLIFAPSPRAMYPAGFESTVSCSLITTRLEGAARPGHFDGVTTVVLKLFNIVQPHFAVFGQKDAQQVLVLKKMVADLNIPIGMIIAPTVRESDGLALSSRNVYLTVEERVQAPIIYRGLSEGLNAWKHGERTALVVKKVITDRYELALHFSTEYISISDFDCVEIEGKLPDKFFISVVCRAKHSNTRLIDNVIVQ